MNVVLLSGGSGKRLWPLSNEVRSKQFLKLFGDGAGGFESMVQRNYRQLKGACPDAEVVIATSRAQLPSIVNQLGGGVHVCVEPERRDTFAAIALACAYLKYELGRSDDEVAIIAPVDPYTEPAFFATFKRLEACVLKTGCELALIGTTPTYPSAKYGYIFPAEGGAVSAFKEKPDEAAAAEYIKQGALWNCGVFALTIGRALAFARKYIEFGSFADVERRFRELPKISFDYEVVERARDVRVLEYSGEWRDLGTWNTLAEAMDSPAHGSVVFGDGCEGTSVINELDAPVFVMGIKNAVIAASADGVIVSDKPQSSYIKPYVDEITLRPQYVEKAWGSYRMLDSVTEDGVETVTRLLHINEGGIIGPKARDDRSATFVAVSGVVELIVSGETIRLTAGQSARVARGAEYTLRALTDAGALEVQLRGGD